MNESSEWGVRRSLTLLVVLTLHVALLAALLMPPRSRSLSASAGHPIELLFIPPAKLPKIRAENYRPRRLQGDEAIAAAPPVLDSDSSPPSWSPPAPGSDGNESGVDWAAEARRALQAFEIRSHQPPGNDSVSGSPTDDRGWPRVAHRAGERFKTANGDWIVWINSSCYQLASSASLALGATLPQTVCPRL